MLDGEIEPGPQTTAPEGIRWKLADLNHATVWLVQWTAGVTQRRSDAEAITVLAGSLRVQRWGNAGHSARTVTAGGQAGFIEGVQHAFTPAADGSAFFAVHVVPARQAAQRVLSSYEADRVFADEVQSRVAQGAKVVDIRNQDERTVQGPLLGAIAVSAELLEHRLDPAGALRLSAAVNANVEWIVVCAQGDDAPAAVAALRRRGLQRVKALVGGFQALRDGGKLDAVLGGVHKHRDAAVMAAH
ncbi:rhodanese-like domain-containing protein [Hoyosella sp. YIM 151337]|uniref:rhodanese-like domain-containing protein n=1 Tax=Hoyosella sp. YIM 151337 TaxID=2992742 RepID=UPI0022368D64|nr:rhodanese-like domain-containing protein [Hoyosella sp. YIM 151337]MCW4352768.1 rhodanese-like domain-containing protein [Hoyosella sp. YIM 151337]